MFGGTSPNSGNVAILYPDTDGSFVKAKREIKNTTANGPTISDGDLFGISVANMGDLNGDGFDDLAIGASKDDAGGTNRGAVHIIYMANNGFVSSSEEINSNTANGPTLSDEDYFGRSVENIGGSVSGGCVEGAVIVGSKKKYMNFLEKILVKKNLKGQELIKLMVWY